MAKKSIADFLDERNKLEQTFREKMEKEGMKLVAEEFMKFFQENPEVEKVKWYGYTPYFNDGDACIYGVYEPTFEFTDEFLEQFVNKEYTENVYQGYDDKKRQSIYKDVTSTAKDIDEVKDRFNEDISEYGEQIGILEEFGYKNQRLFDNLHKLGKFITDMDDACLLIFGDHSEISIGRNDKEFTVEEFSHD